MKTIYKGLRYSLFTVLFLGYTFLVAFQSVKLGVIWGAEFQHNSHQCRQLTPEELKSQKIFDFDRTWWG